MLLLFLFLLLQAEEARRLEELRRSEESPSPLPPQASAPATSLEDLGGPAEGGEDGVRPQEASQVEEILRLEREIQVLQRQKEQQELSLTEASLNRLQLLRDQELRRLEDEACRAAQQFLDSLNFDEIDECVRSIETSLGGGEDVEGEEAKKARGGGRPRRHEDEEVDEGFGADDDAFKDSPNPSEHGHSDGQRTSGIRTSDDSSEEDPYANEGVAPPLTLPLPPPNLLLQPLPPVPSTCLAVPCSPSDTQSDHQVELIPPDEESDYDQDDYDEGAVVSSGGVAFSGGQWSPDYRGSVGTYSSSGVYRFSSEGPQSSVSSLWVQSTLEKRLDLLLSLSEMSAVVSFQFEDSEDDFDRFDTDDELSYRRDSVYSCVTLPYFHSFLFIKGNFRASQWTSSQALLMPGVLIYQ